MQKWVWFSSVMGALAVALGAFGAHGLKGMVSADELEIWKTAAHYHLIHSVVLLVLALNANEKFVWAKRLIATGMGIFGGSLYLLVVTHTKWLGAITPIGGVCLIAGWIMIAREATRSD